MGEGNQGIRKLTRPEAVKELEDMGSPMIVSEEWANLVGAPFGVEFRERGWKRGPDAPWGKGPTSDCVGVDVHVIPARICDALGIERRFLHGRGSQFESDLAQIRLTIR